MDLSIWLGIYVALYIICMISYKYIDGDPVPMAYFAMLFVAPLVPLIVIGVVIGKFIKAGNPSGDDD